MGAGPPFYEGTSMASPQVAGVAALIMRKGVTDPGVVAASYTPLPEILALKAMTATLDMGLDAAAFARFAGR